MVSFARHSREIRGDLLDSLQLRRNFSRNILIRMFIFGLVVAGLLYWKLDFIAAVYFRDQLTSTGFIINGAILGLFLLGLARIIVMLIGYQREETALADFAYNLDDGLAPLYEIPKESMIARRYVILEKLHKANTPINQSALATTLIATESTRSSFPKFINNILILSGVFGTIVSLSIALIGASDLLSSAVNVDGMGLVVHGMSTALSTTITAIVCYVFFGYFYMKSTDVQTNLVSGIEQVTATHLIPKFQVQTESILFEFSGLIRSLQQLVQQMEASQDSFSMLAHELRDSQDNTEALEQLIANTLNQIHQHQAKTVTQEMEDIKHLLKAGFRLSEEP